MAHVIDTHTEVGVRAMRVLVTGHDGYIGAVMTEAMIDAGHTVVGLDTGWFHCNTFGDETVVVPAIYRDIRDVTLTDLAGFDAVVHLAALCNDPLGDLNPELTAEINFRASVRLAKLARQAGVSRFLYASSCSMYGASGDEILTEEAPLAPITAYAESKVRAEEEISMLADDKFSPIYLRNATAYGASPRLRADVVLNNLVCWAVTTRKVRILSDGTPWRPIVHVRDIAAAFVACLEAPRERIHNEAFNVGVNGENYRVKEIAEIVRDNVPGCDIEFAGVNNPDPRNYRVDFSKIANQLPEFRAKWNAVRGASELYDAFREHGLTQDDFQNRRFVRLGQLRHLVDTGRLDADLRWADGGMNG